MMSWIDGREGLTNKGERIQKQQAYSYEFIETKKPGETNPPGFKMII